MKKATNFLVLVLSLLFMMGVSGLSSVEAGIRERAKEGKICAVLVATPDMKTEDYMNAVDDVLNGNEQRKKIAFGTEMQTKYQEYWLSKGELEEGKLTKAIIHDFVKFSGYDKCLFLVSTANIEKTKMPGGWFSTIEQTRASVEVKGFLADSNQILKVISVSKNDDSKASDLRAKRGAFEKCMVEVGNLFYTYLKTGK